jgi:phospholipid transport system substrate-binding protein
MSRSVAGVFVALLVCLLHGEAGATSPTDQMRGFFATAGRILDDPGAEGTPEARLDAIRGLVSDMFDFREAAQLSLGPEWSVRTPAERTEFVRLFAELLERSFIVGIASRIRLADGVRVRFLGESIDGTLATVRTAIETKSGLDLPFSYRMVERGDRWAVRDVVVDGMSLAANYRAQFVRIMQASSYRDLIQQMQARVSGPPTATLSPEAPAVASPAAATSPPGPQATRVRAPEVMPVLATSGTAPDPERRDLATVVRAMPDKPAPPPVAARAVTEREATRADARPREPLADGAGPVAELLTASSQPASLPAVPAPRPVSTRRTSAKSYWVQVGAFTNFETARRLASELRAESPPAPPNRWVVVVAPATAGASFARVRIGPFSRRADAASALREFEDRGYRPFIAEAHD